jgi:hypothetical protein
MDTLAHKVALLTAKPNFLQVTAPNPVSVARANPPAMPRVG